MNIILINLRVSSHTPPHIIFLKGILYHLNEFNIVFPNHLFIWNIKPLFITIYAAYVTDCLFCGRKASGRFWPNSLALKHDSVSGHKKGWSIKSRPVRFSSFVQVIIECEFKQHFTRVSCAHIWNYTRSRELIPGLPVRRAIWLKYWICHVFCRSHVIFPVVWKRRLIPDNWVWTTHVCIFI
jgi:hypothetical protein